MCKLCAPPPPQTHTHTPAANTPTNKQEASIAWEKRQAEVRAKVQQEADRNSWASWWDNVAGVYACWCMNEGNCGCSWGCGLHTYSHTHFYTPTTYKHTCTPAVPHTCCCPHVFCAGGSAGANMYAQAQEATRRAATGSYSSYDGGDDPTSSGSYDGEDYYSGSNGSSGGSSNYNGTKEGARIAKLAAKAARAARQWKSWQELQQRSRRAGLLLTASVSSSGEQED